jgi:hypothetical protein
MVVPHPVAHPIRAQEIVLHLVVPVIVLHALHQAALLVHVQEIVLKYEMQVVAVVMIAPVQLAMFLMVVR